MFCCLMKVYCIIYVSCVTLMVFCVCMNDSVHLLYTVLVYTSACGEATCDEL